MKTTVCVVTGSRAEYGLFCPLLELIAGENVLRLQIAVTGMHLSPEYGLTYREIIRDGFTINARVPIPLDDDPAVGMARSIGAGVSGFAKAFQRLKPDRVVLLGDRFETFSAAIAAFTARIPIIHLQGGELTEGALDDAFRHAITKMSMFHCTSTRQYRQRVIQLGEQPGRVYNTGALGIDNIRKLQLLSRNELEVELGCPLQGTVILVTFHPATLENNRSCGQFKEVLAALGGFKEAMVVFTRPNADTGSTVISGLINAYLSKHPGRSAAFTSLGRLRYLSLLKHADVVLGNSSSGIIEAPSLCTPTVDVGDRQKGRIRAVSVVQCAPERSAVAAALRRVLSPSFADVCSRVRNPYGDGTAARKILAVIKRRIPGGREGMKKKFFDMERLHV